MEDYPYKQKERPARMVLFGCSLGFIVRVLAEDDKALQDGGDREVLLCGQLSPLSMSEQHWCGVSLETCDGFWLACLAHDIHSLDTDHTKQIHEIKSHFSFSYLSIVFFIVSLGKIYIFMNFDCFLSQEKNCNTHEWQNFHYHSCLYISQSNYPRLYLSNSDRHRQWSELLIECDQHTWLHGCYQAVENIVRFPQDYCNAHNEHQGEY